MSSALAFAAIDHFTLFEFPHGCYSILTGLFVLGGAGWLTRSRETRIRRHNQACTAVVCERVGDLTAVVGKLRAEVQGRRMPVDPDELQEQVERFVIEELGTRESVRSQGYAEGYVDGIARRDDPSSN